MDEAVVDERLVVLLLGVKVSGMLTLQDKKV